MMKTKILRQPKYLRVQEFTKANEKRFHFVFDYLQFCLNRTAEKRFNHARVLCEAKKTII